jgi:hypothetical protein
MEPRASDMLGKCSVTDLLFFVVLEFELRAYTLSHSTSPLL